MTKERKVLAWLALVGSLVICCPCALCSGFEAVSSFAAAPTPEMLAPFVPEGMVFSPQYLTIMALAFAIAALIALVVGVVGVVWGVRMLLSTPRKQGQPTTG